jgi:FdhD protein
MDDEAEVLPVLKITEQGRTVFVNGQELVTLLCSPTNQKYLVVGFLLSEGFINDKGDIKEIAVDGQKGVARVQTTEGKDLVTDVMFKRMITSGCGRGATFYNVADIQSRVKVESQLKISAVNVFNLVREFQRRSEIFKATGGVHSAALCEATDILVFHEDIGRHNAIDKVFGECILNDIPTTDRIVVTSGRVSSEILLKVNKRNIPLLISRAAPTDQGVKLARDMGITLVGFVRGNKMNVYANEWRIEGYD